jgi:predicted negative regulator of RcsB-dependent stress response
MAYDLEEQEQIASLKAFWNKFGNLITWVLILALGGFAGFQYWENSKRGKAVEASALYDQLQVAVTAKDEALVKRIVTDVEAKYAGSIYASMSALVAARQAFDKEDLKTAKEQLNWVIANGNEEYKAIARLRLSGVLLDEKAYDEGMKLLAGAFPAAFAGEVADRKGDILVAQNKLAEAREAYLAALAAMDEQNPGRQLVTVKLEAIGGTAPAPKAAA